jgi:hypothetical protein
MAAGLRGLAAGQQLTESSQAKLNKLGDLLSEIDLADSIMKLELGVAVTSTIKQLDKYLARLQEKHEAAAQQDVGEAAETVTSSTPRSPGGVSVNLLKEKEAGEKCAALVQELQGDGLVVLGLAAVQYKQLGSLKEAAGNIKAGMDGLQYDRSAPAREPRPALCFLFRVFKVVLGLLHGAPAGVGLAPVDRHFCPPFRPGWLV